MGEPGNDRVIPGFHRFHSVEKPMEIGKEKDTKRDKEPLAAEEQPTVKQTPDAAIPANRPVKEAVAIDPEGVRPLQPIHPQVIEAVQQVIRHFNSAPRNRPTSMRLQVNPKELGVIDVQMVSSNQGVHVTFFAEQETTGKLLENQLGQLRESLVNSGVQLSGLDIHQHGQSGQKGETFDRNTDFAQSSKDNLRQSETGAQETTRAGRRIGQTSEIDYFI
jgi:flagellar hook-length control protein FliK